MLKSDEYGYPGTDADFDKKIDWLKNVVSKGDLTINPKIKLNDKIAKTLIQDLDEIEKYVSEVLKKSFLLQKREQWKRHGLFFENFRKYEIEAENEGLIERAEEVSKRLAALSKVYSTSIEGVKLAEAVGF